MRLVSLCPSLTELLFDLGRGADLVGVTEWCVHPADGVAAIEKVGGTKTPRLERIVALAPDLVFLNREENRREDARALKAAGIRCHTSLPRDPAETAAMVRSVGAAVGSSDRAGRLAAEIERRAATVGRHAAERPRVRFACLIWRRPWMAAAGGTYLDSLLTLAGGENLFAEAASPYPEIDLDELVARAPEAVLLTTEPYAFGERDADRLAADAGIERRRVRVVDGEALTWHGARTPAGIDYAAAVIDAAR